MSTVAKAADLIGQVFPEYLSCRCEKIARILDNAGLLMSDLPAPDRKGDWGPSWEGVVEAEPGHYAVRILIEGRQYRQSSQYARSFALALLAAANHAEAQARGMTEGTL